jgi:hypothetical protein
MQHSDYGRSKKPLTVKMLITRRRMFIFSKMENVDVEEAMKMKKYERPLNPLASSRAESATGDHSGLPVEVVLNEKYPMLGRQCHMNFSAQNKSRGGHTSDVYRFDLMPLIIKHHLKTPFFHRRTWCDATLRLEAKYL